MTSQVIPHKMYGDDPSLPVLICMHGFLGDKDDWSTLAHTLGKRCRLLAVDLPGHADNHPDNWNDVTFRSVADDLNHLIEKLNLPASPVLGYSMGGRLALYFSTIYPDCCKALILESASPGLPTEQERADRRQNDESLANRLEEIGTARFVEQWYQIPLFASLAANATLLSEVTEKRSRGVASQLAFSLRALGTGCQPSLWPDLGQVNCPVLLMAGELDSKYTNLASEMASLFRQADVRIIQSAGHNVHLERPELFADAVCDFLDRKLNSIER